MTLDPLGRLERVNLREVWESEPGHFTPWLAQKENLSLLGETLQIDLELVGEEQSVGPFRADILCHDTATEDWVLIENQLERTDHIHLGQLLTYAAGLDTVTIIWVAAHFTDEHRAALDWLNEITDQKFNFFGLEVEVWKIGNSPPAPKFNVVCEPNDWVRSIRQSAAASGTSETRSLQLEFWLAFSDYLDEHSSLRGSKPSPRNYYTVSIGRTGFVLSAVANVWDLERSLPNGSLRAELVIEDRSHAASHFQTLQESKDSIEREFGESLEWSEVDGRTSRKVLVTRRDIDISDRDNWSDYHAWLCGKLTSLHRVFASRIRTLTP